MKYLCTQNFTFLFLYRWIVILSDFKKELGQHQFIDFCERLQQRLAIPLPGPSSHLKMASQVRLREMESEYNTTNAVRSSVLILLYLKNKVLHTAFILRQTYDGIHSGQISFPGGRWEEGDGSLINTALREAHEEVNVNPESVNILGSLSEMYIPPSNHLVLPVIGYTLSEPQFLPDKLEVDKIIESDISFLFEPEKVKQTLINVRGFEIEAPYFDVKNQVIWGATAMILSELRDIIEGIE